MKTFATILSALLCAAMLSSGPADAQTVAASGDPSKPRLAYDANGNMILVDGAGRPYQPVINQPLDTAPAVYPASSSAPAAQPEAPAASAEAMGNEEDPSPFDSDYLKGFYKVPYAMITRPFDISERALLIDAAAIGGFGILYALDKDIRTEANDPQADDAEDFFDHFEPLGSLYTVLALTGGTYVAGEVAGIPSMQRVGLNGTQAVALAAIPVGATKYLFGRKRPNKNQGNGQWFDGGNSFLSGHTTYAFTLASVVAHEYQDTGWVPWVAYGTASMVGAQRIYADKHWASDVFLSALVGWGIGQAVSDMDYFTKDLPIDMKAMTEPNTQGIELSYKW